jgi:hypothetical protein
VSSRNSARVDGAGLVATAAFASLMFGCGWRHKAASAPPAPVTVAAAGPLSSPQVTDPLPPPQPVPPEAIPRPPEEQQPAEPAPPQPPPGNVERPHPAVSSRGPVGPTAPPAAAPPPPHPPPAAAGAAPQLRPMLSAAQERELRGMIERSLMSAEQYLAQAGSRPADKERSADAERVRAFIEQAHQAWKQGDLNRARSLAERAELLAAALARAPR